MTYPAWRHIPTAYLVCEKDNAIPPKSQDFMIERARYKGCKILVERCQAGHSPFLSVPETVVEVIRQVAGEDM